MRKEIERVPDFASAGNKMSLKKLEIKMGIHHQELGLPLDQLVPEEFEYCDNDVISTEAALARNTDFTCKELVEVVGEPLSKGITDGFK